MTLPSAVMQFSVTTLSVAAADGTRLAISLWLPEGDGPFATLLEALPYRKDDVTSSYAESYERFCGEGGFAGVRLDLRGCDLWTFREGKVVKKDSYWKIVTER